MAHPKSKIHKLTDYVVFDIETTGLDKNKEIIEFAALRVRNGNVVDEKEILVKPLHHIRDDVVKLTGISNEMVADKPSIKDVAKDIFDFIADDVVLGHNIASFDLPILDKLATEIGWNFNNSYFDTCIYAKKKFKNESATLIDLAKRFNIEVKTIHRACADCYTTYNVYNCLMEETSSALTDKQETEQNGKVTATYYPVENKELSVCYWHLLTPSEGSFSLFNNEEDKINYLKKEGIINSTQIKPFFYKGAYSFGYCPCTIIGHTDTHDVIIDIDGHLHSVNCDCFAEMQPLKKYIPLYINNKPIYVDNEKDPGWTIPDCFEKIGALSAYKSFLSLEKREPSTGVYYAVMCKDKITNASLVIAHIKSIKNDELYEVKTKNKIQSEELEFIKFDTAYYIYRFRASSEKLFEYFLNIFSVLDKYIEVTFPAEPFGCCSRYVECSDAKKCIHPDILHCLGCMYRENLMNGKIFYGKNANNLK